MKKSFTLIELLAVIVILAVILVIAVPKITDTIRKSKEGVFINSAKLIASSVEKKLEENKVLDIENPLTCESVVSLSEKDYLKCEINIINDITYITLVGKGKFENMSICNKNKDNIIISETCSILLEIDLDGGTMDNKPNESQNIGTKILLENPSKPNYRLTKWEIVEGNSIFNEDGELEIGTKNTTIKAIWENDYTTYSELIADYRCGSTSAGSAPYIIDYDQPCTIEKENTNDWVIKLKYNGILSVNNLSNIDIFLVGGGGGASGGTYTAINFEWGYYSLGSGGGGGYTTTYSNIAVESNSIFDVEIGAGGDGCVGYCTATSGGETRFKETTDLSGKLNYAVSGGAGASRQNGGAGGHGGGAGNVTDNTGYNWQGGTVGNSQAGDTYEFNDSAKQQYAKGGIAGSNCTLQPNTGDGGCVGHYFNANGYTTGGGAGTTGIIVIRNART